MSPLHKILESGSVAARRGREQGIYITKENEETSVGNKCVPYLDCGDGFTGINTLKFIT